MIRYARNIEPHPLYARNGVNPHLHHLLTDIAAHEHQYPESGEIATVILSLGRTDLFPQLGQALAAEGHPDAKTLNWKRVGRAVAIDRAMLGTTIRVRGMSDRDLNWEGWPFDRFHPGTQRAMLRHLTGDHEYYTGVTGVYGRLVEDRMRQAAQKAIPDAKETELRNAFRRIMRRAQLLEGDSRGRSAANGITASEVAGRPPSRYDVVEAQSPVALPTEIRTSRPRDPRRMSRKSFATGPRRYARSDIAPMLESISHDPYNTLQPQVLADMLQEEFGESPLWERLRGHANGTHENLWHDFIDNSAEPRDFDLPENRQDWGLGVIGRHGPFDLYYGHEGSPGQSMRHVVTAVPFRQFRTLHTPIFRVEIPHGQELTDFADRLRQADSRVGDNMWSYAAQHEASDPRQMSRLPRGLKLRLSRAAQAHRSIVVRYKKCPRCGSASKKTQSIMYRWRCKNCGLSHGRTAYAEEGGMPWVHGGKKGYARPGQPRRYAKGPSPAARILESHLRDQGMHHAAAIVRGHYAQEKRMGGPTTVPLSWMGPLHQDHTTHDSTGDDGLPVPTVTVTEPHEKGMMMMLSLHNYDARPHDPEMNVIGHYMLVNREHVPNWLKALDKEGIHNADREYRLFTRRYGLFPHHDPELPPEFPPEEGVDWRPNEVIPEDYYSGGGEAHQYEAYRAPAGGTIVRSIYYPGGSLIPDLKKFAPTRPARRTPR